MPGYPNLAGQSYGATMGYAMPGYDPENPFGDYGEVSHTAFIVWLLVLVLASVAILGGLKVGGFSFVFRTR